MRCNLDEESEINEMNDRKKMMEQKKKKNVKMEGFLREEKEELEETEK